MGRLVRLLRALQDLKRTEIPFGIGVGITSAIVANAWLARRIKFTPDGYNHAVRMLMAAGYRYETALPMAAQFYQSQPIARDPRFAHIFNGSTAPEHWDLFAPRVLYPQAAAALFEFRGFEALTDISRGSYIGTAVAAYLLLLNFTRPWLAAALALGIVLAPRVRALSCTDQTHTPALFLWTVTLDAMCRSIKCGTASQFVYALSCFSLSFTRPVPYLPFGAAAGALCAGILQRDPAKKKAAGAMAAVAILSTLALGFVAAQLNAPGLRRLIREAHSRALEARHAERYEGLGFFRKLYAAVRHDAGPADQPIVPWYARAILMTTTNAVAHAVAGVMPVIATFGIIKKREHVCNPLLLGATAGSMIGIVADPVPKASAQTILVPLYPVVAAGCALAADFFIDLLLQS